MSSLGHVCSVACLARLTLNPAGGAELLMAVAVETGQVVGLHGARIGELGMVGAATMVRIVVNKAADGSGT